MAAPIALRPGAGSAAENKVKMATGLRATVQSIVWLGAETGIFRKHGLDVDFVRFEVGGPASAAGLVRGEWTFVQTGTVPMVEAVLQGHDAVILCRNHVPLATNIIMANPAVTSLRQLDGKKVGVLTDVHSGQTGVITRLAIEKAGATATYVGLGTFENIYASLAKGEIDAGALQVDYRFVGKDRYGWRVFETEEFGVPSIFGTTRRSIAGDRETALGMVRGFVETIHLFKTRPDVVVPLLQDFLRFTDRKAVEDLRTYFAPLLPAVPRPNFGPGIKDLQNLFAKRYPAAETLQESDVVDASLIDEVERSGFIERLYGAKP
jgi:ABC-type nitrate/sulfonate/bicarbonate transport system substrate-binding protein